MAMGPAGSTLRENAVPSHKKKSLRRRWHDTNDRFVNTDHIDHESELLTSCCRDSPQEIMNSGAKKMGRRNIVTSIYP
jgi:hypothetical protein